MAFCGCTKLSTVKIPNKVTEIGENAFRDCTGLKKIRIPGNVKTVWSAFEGCTNLENAELEYGIKKLGYYMFFGCTSLESITIPDSVTVVKEIESEAFNSKNVTINYCGTKKQWDAIKKGELKYKKVNYSVFNVPATFRLSKSSYVYNGKAIKPSVIAAYRGKKLKKGTDYKVEYKNNINVGTASVTITGLGKYKGTVKKTFKIVPKTTKITSLKNTASKKMTVKWKKKSSTNGYQLQYGLKSNFKGAKTVTISKNATISRVIKSLKKGKKYFVRVRTYKTVNGKKYLSHWSAVKTVTIKK